MSARRNNRKDKAEAPAGEQVGPGGALPFMCLRPAYELLLRDLLIAFQGWKAQGDGGREGVRLSVQAIIAFLRRRHVNPELGAALLQILVSLEEVRLGREPPLFARRRRAEEKSQSAQAWHARMIASACAEVLMSQGDSKQAAGEFVARHVAKWSIFRKAKTMTAHKVLRWRDEFINKGPRHSRQFDQVCSELAEGRDVRGKVRRLLQRPPLASENPET